METINVTRGVLGLATQVCDETVVEAIQKIAMATPKLVAEGFVALPRKDGVALATAIRHAMKKRGVTHELTVLGTSALGLNALGEAVMATVVEQNAH